MKKFALILGLITLAWARADAFWEDQTRHPMPNAFVSAEIHVSSRINYNSATPPGPVIISSYPAFLYGIIVSSVGSNDAKLEVFDANSSTSRVIRQIAAIDLSRLATALPPIPFNIFCSSGITINNTGTTVADVTLIWRIH